MLLIRISNAFSKEITPSLYIIYFLLIAKALEQFIICTIEINFFEQYFLLKFALR